MKKIYKTLYLSFLACLLCMTCVFGVTFYAHAGVSEISVFESDDLTGTASLPGSLWYFDRADMSGTSVSDNEITFSPTASDSRFNLKRKINDLSDCGIDLNFEMSGKFLLSQMPSGARFLFAFGMAKVNIYPSEGSTALYFENRNGKVGFGVAAYGSSAEEKKEFTAIPDFSSGEYVQVRFEVDAEGNGSGTVNGVVFEVSGLPVSGFAGFGQIAEGSGRVSVKIKDLSVTAYDNQTPENTDVFEDFEQNCFNGNVFQTKSRASGLANSKLCVENGRLCFRNTGSAFVETKYKYSNVDVAFDVVEIQKETVFNTDGTIAVARSCAFGVAFGIDVIGRGMQTKAPLVVTFVPDRDLKTNTLVVISSGLETLSTTVLPEKYNMFGTDGVFGVKVSVRDGKISVMIKASGENGYKTVIKMETGTTPNGYFQIAALGAFDSNLQKNLGAEQLLVGSFALDNLSVKNNDVGREQVLVDYLSSNANLAKDYVYENEWSDSDLLESTIK